MGKDVSKEQIIVKYENGKLSQTTDQYATEFPLTIRVNGNEFATIICSPNHLEELVLGFLASEGVISKIDELESIQIGDSKEVAQVELTHQLGNFFDYSTKCMIASCCGKVENFTFKTMQSSPKHL